MASVCSRAIKKQPLAFLLMSTRALPNQSVNPSGTAEILLLC
jgi:hypothetical protein